MIAEPRALIVMVQQGLDGDGLEVAAMGEMIDGGVGETRDHA